MWLDATGLRSCKVRSKVLLRQPRTCVEKLRVELSKG